MDNILVFPQRSKIYDHLCKGVEAITTDIFEQNEYESRNLARIATKCIFGELANTLANKEIPLKKIGVMWLATLPRELDNIAIEMKLSYETCIKITPQIVLMMQKIPLEKKTKCAN